MFTTADAAIDDLAAQALAGGPALVTPGCTIPSVPDGVALVVPTSGSTGTPKYVGLGLEAITSSARASAERLGGAGRWVQFLPETHIAGMNVVFRSLLAGFPAYRAHLDGGFTCDAFADACRSIATEGLAAEELFTSLVPTQLVRLMRGAGPAWEALTRFRAVLVGGAALSNDLLHEARDRGARVVNTYGMAETCGGCVYDGAPLSGVGIHTTDDGVIRIQGPVVALGYLDADGGWADSPISITPFGSRCVTTRDLGAIDPDGRLRVIGRADHVINSGGLKLVPEAIEELLETAADIRRACVVGVPDPEWGQRAIALVQANNGRTVDVGSLRRRVADVLGGPSVPKAFHLLAQVPELAPGKLDRDRALHLAQRLEADSPARNG